MKRPLLYLLLLCGAYSTASAQSESIRQTWIEQHDSTSITPFKPEYVQYTQEQILRGMDQEPSFGMYRDNYFITGVPTNKQPSSRTADAKFQISIRHRLLRGWLPLNSYLALVYTQKSFWDIYQDSAPFGDSNYNPGLVLITPITHHNQVHGLLSIGLEHESNGRGGADSRSWNFLSLSGVYFYNRYFFFQSKLWLAQVSRRDNPDLLDYRGYGLIALNYRSFSERFAASGILNPTRHGLNTTIELAARLTKRANYYFFLQWEQGYGSSLLHYKEYSSMLRLGIALKPPMRSIF